MDRCHELEGASPESGLVYHPSRRSGVPVSNRPRTHPVKQLLNRQKMGLSVNLHGNTPFMTPQDLSESRLSKALFLAILLVYVVSFFFSQRLTFPLIWDEQHYWKTSLLFSQSLIPDLRNYGELSTPLPFIMFGALEYFFKWGIFSGRLLNLVLSFVMTCLICLPARKTVKHSLLIGCAVLSCPYYLWLSSHLYTDIIASFFVLLGFWFYIRSQNILSGLSFVLAIASRQYMLAFPLAIAAFELFSARRTGPQVRIRWLAQLVASLSIVGWFLLFKGLIPQMALRNPNLPDVPTVQLNWWSLQPNNGLYFLTCVGLYFVIPELILFRRKTVLKDLLTRKSGFLILGLALLFVLFPPPLEAHGLLTKMLRLLPNDLFKIASVYFLALLACVRFSRINLAFWALLMNCGLMMKAHQWDKYVLPLLVTFWYLKSVGALDVVTGLSKATVFEGDEPGHDALALAGSIGDEPPEDKKEDPGPAERTSAFQLA